MDTSLGAPPPSTEAAQYWHALWRNAKCLDTLSWWEEGSKEFMLSVERVSLAAAYVKSFDSHAVQNESSWGRPREVVKTTTWL